MITSKEDLDKIERWLLHDKKVNAIKEMRKHTGLSLKEAKRHCDEFICGGYVWSKEFSENYVAIKTTDLTYTPELPEPIGKLPKGLENIVKVRNILCDVASNSADSYSEGGCFGMECSECGLSALHDEDGSNFLIHLVNLPSGQE